MHLNQWLQQVYEEELTKTAGADLERVYDQLEPEELLKIACGEADLATVLEKRGEKMSLQRREGLSSKQFAVPESKAKKIGVSGEIKGEAKGKYPIPDEKHARNALSRVSTFGTPAEREAVRKKVYSKYPALRTGFEERHGGASPTSKGNVKKQTQGGISKAAMAKLAFVDSVARALAHTHTEVEKDAGLQRSRRLLRAWAKADIAGKMTPALEAAESKTMKKLHLRNLRLKAREMTKSDEFTSPEAQTKAKVMRSAMKSVKGAPTKVRKAAVGMAGKKLQQIH